MAPNSARVGGLPLPLVATELSPLPRPSRKRSPLSSASDMAALDVTDGCRVTPVVTADPTRMRRVLSAMAVMLTHSSRQSTGESATHTASRPSCSARRLRRTLSWGARVG